MTPSERFNELKRKRFCFQCLSPGRAAHHDGFCFDKFKCLDKVTGKFPKYPLKEAGDQIRQFHASEGGDVGNLPKLAKEVGGETEIMIGSLYLKYHPE